MIPLYDADGGFVDHYEESALRSLIAKGQATVIRDRHRNIRRVRIVEPKQRGLTPDAREEIDRIRAGIAALFGRTKYTYIEPLPSNPHYIALKRLNKHGEFVRW